MTILYFWFHSSHGLEERKPCLPPIIGSKPLPQSISLNEAERIGEFHTLMIIPRPLEDLEETLPTADYWIETPTPVNIPMLALQEEQREFVELPNLEIAEMETITIGDR